ncbi:hypothetical protein [Streptococcus iniae]|uniref:hypothetical protein n=1 Tax=Streptococcus iniae TaxID=1346 RepID=UPI00115E37F4|nr:hypothetical protein [Streptococcus iniae]
MAENLLISLGKTSPEFTKEFTKLIDKKGLMAALAITLGPQSDNTKNALISAIETATSGSKTVINKARKYLTKLGEEGKAGKLVSKIGFGLDFYTQVSEGENVVNAGIKSAIHTTVSNTIIGKTTSLGIAVGAGEGTLVLPGVGTIGNAIIGGVAGAATGVAISISVNNVIDEVYDNTVGNIVDKIYDNTLEKNK